MQWLDCSPEIEGRVAIATQACHAEHGMPPSSATRSWSSSSIPQHGVRYTDHAPSFNGSIDGEYLAEELFIPVPAARFKSNSKRT